MKSIHPPTSLSRRQFLRAAVTTTVAAPLILRSGARAASPNGKLQHACIGVTRMGKNDLKNFLDHDRLKIVALCDVDTNHLDEAAKSVPDARRYTDWRELFEKEGDKIDSVNVTTPDHMHFPIAYMAIQRGKNVYCQKPMCHDVTEVRTLTEAAAKKGVITQLGTQHASEIGDRMAVQFLKDGVIGKIKHVYLCSNRAAPNRLKGPRPAQGEDPPPNLKWDLWIGTAPMRPYVPKIYHPATWRGWLDFATSWVADMGCHIFDATWRALGLKAPLTITAKVEESWKNSPERRADNWPQSEHVTWTFPGNALTEGKELTVEWFDGPIFLPPKEAQAHNPTDKYPSEAALVVGTEGTLLQPVGSGPLLLPLEKFKTYPRPKLLPRSHYAHYVDACLGGEKTESHFTQTGPMTETILLGALSLRFYDKKLTWDPVTMKIASCPEAERFLKRQYRDGWQIAGV